MNACSAMSPASRIPTRRARRAPKPRMLLEHDQRDERERQPERRAAVAEVAPEHLQVLRRRERRDRDQDHVVEQDRPARDEADELVEGVAGEDRRAAAVLVQRGALDVGHRGQREHHRRDQEHERRQPERVAGDHAEREVDRARQRGVDDREQDRRADAAPDDHARASRELGPSAARARRARQRRARDRRASPLRPRSDRGPRRRSRPPAPPELDVDPAGAGRDEQHARSAAARTARWRSRPATRTNSATPIATIANDSTNVPPRCSPRPFISL